MKLRPRSKRAYWPEHLPEALGRRLVEAVELLDLLDALGVDALPAAIRRRVAGALRAPRFGDVLLHRSARDELRHDKVREARRTRSAASGARV
jgi:hypothetical protein